MNADTISTELKILRGADGLRTMVICTSNSYRDRDKEFITTSALKEWVDRQWQDGRYIGANPLLFWHDDPPIGEIVYSELHDVFLLEVAKERDEPFARAIWDLVEANPTQWGASHGFQHKENAPPGNGRTFHWINKFETTLLPFGVASNALTEITV